MRKFKEREASLIVRFMAYQMGIWWHQRLRWEELKWDRLGGTEESMGGQELISISPSNRDIKQEHWIHLELLG